MFSDKEYSTQNEFNVEVVDFTDNQHIMVRTLGSDYIEDKVKNCIRSGKPQCIAKHCSGWIHLVEPKVENEAVFHTIKLSVNPYKSKLKVSEFIEKLNSGTLKPTIHTKVVYKKVA